MKKSIPEIKLNGESLTINDLYSVVYDSTPVKLSAASVVKVEKSRRYVEDLVKKEKIVYGVTTGFGEFASVGIKKQDAAMLQKNLIMSHAAGCGENYRPEFVRSAMLLRVNALAKGYSGITLKTLQTLIDLINHNITPMVPIHGSVGSSGDLAPLSHIVLAMLGMGEVLYKGKVIKAEAALRQAKIPAAELSYKEGLALINGTQMMCGIGALLVRRARELYLLANTAAALSTEALMGTPKAFDPLISMVRPHKGQLLTSKIMCSLIKGSGIVKSHTDCGEVQDAYSIRCIPQVHGAVYDAVKYVETVIDVEMNSATDNPLIFPDENEVISGGNFHGEPLAMAMDFLGIAAAELASISERRSDRLVNPNNSHRTLPAFLIKNGGLNSGFMIAQYTAASVVSENKVLAHPAVVDSIPTSANKEDFNSMGSISARKCIKIIENTEYALAIELLLACQGLDFRLPVKSSAKLMKVHSMVRKHITHMSEDRILSEDINKIVNLIKTPEFNELIESICKV